MIASIIIPTFDRNELLSIGLASLSRQKIDGDFEVIVLNEFVNDVSEAICRQYPNVRYVLTRPKETRETIKWRCPGVAINIGVKLATTPNVVISCPEIYHCQEDVLANVVEPLIESSKLLTYPAGFDDRAGRILKAVRSGDVFRCEVDRMTAVHALNTQYPFFMGINRNEFLSIGGYDEDFQKGYCFDDADFVNRLLRNGCSYRAVQGEIMHLYHPRLRYGHDEVKSLWKLNEALYLERFGIVVRNQGREWGQIES